MTTTPNLWRAGFTVNTSLAGHQGNPDVAATAGDQFFAVWVDETNFNMGADTIVARKFDSLGNPLTGEVILDPGLINNADQPAAVRLPIAGQADGLAVAFTDFIPASTDANILLARRDANLAQIGATPTIVIDNSTAVTDHPSITSFSDGSLLVAYTLQNSATNFEI